jgi:hypothetical protein
VRAWLSLVLIVVLDAALYIGCAPTKELKRTPRTLSLPAVLEHVLDRNSKIKTLAGDGSITVESPEQSSSGSFDVRLKKPDSLCLDLSGPFGIHVGTLQLSREQIIFYNRMDNTAVVGTPDGKTMNDLFHMRLRFDEILRAFTGEFPIPSDSDSVQQVTIENDQYVIRQPGDDGMTYEYRIDPDSFVVTAYRVLDADGRPILTALASEFDDEDDVVMPRLLRVIFPKERRSLSIAYGHLQFNEPVSCSFSIPKQADIIRR